VKPNGLKATIERRSVRSSVDGVVTRVELHEGEFADPLATLLVIAEICPLLVEIFLPIEAYPLVKVGMQAEIRLQEPIDGRHVSSIWQSGQRDQPAPLQRRFGQPRPSET
jgi:multidrug resistance efflux pump